MDAPDPCVSPRAPAAFWAIQSLQTPLEPCPHPTGFFQTHSSVPCRDPSTLGFSLPFLRLQASSLDPLFWVQLSEPQPCWLSVSLGPGPLRVCVSLWAPGTSLSLSSPPSVRLQAPGSGLHLFWILALAFLASGHLLALTFSLLVSSPLSYWLPSPCLPSSWA